MPSPSPTSRKSSSSRCNPGLFRADPLASRVLHQGILTSSTNSAASRNLHEKVDDHKENSTENGNSRGAHGRSNQNLRGASKKPWVTHFAKPTTTLSPGKRILGDRNSSCSPVRSGSITPGNGEALCDKKVPTATPPRDQQQGAPVTPGPVKDVAELSKRIQQFLEDQDVLLGIKTSSNHEVTSTSASVTPVDPWQRALSSPYNPYKSPFFERPTFLRLNGNASSMEGDDMAATAMDNGADMQNTGELSQVEGDQILVTRLQQAQLSTSFSEISTEAENAQELISGTATLEGACEDALEEASEEAKVVPILKEEAKCLNETKEEVGKRVTHLWPALPSKTSEEDEDGSVTAESHVQAENMTKKIENQSGAGNVAQFRIKEDKVLSVSAIPLAGFQISQDEAQKIVPKESAGYDEVQLVDKDVPWGKRAARVTFCGTLLAAFLALALLSSASPGLLPASLINNPVHTFWYSSKYHEHSLMFVCGMDGLWSTEMIYIPADVRIAVVKGAELLQYLIRLCDQANQELQLYAQVTSSILDDWRKGLVQHLSLSKSSATEEEQEDRGRQFEWIQDFEFEDEWLDEIPELPYTDWELLHEYDLSAANEFVLGSISETLKNDLRRNFSRISDAPEVKGLLEDLMKLKGGNTEEDRLEVLQYFWEYTRYSGSAHESLMKFQVGPTAVEDENTSQSSPSSPKTVEADHDHHSEMMQSTGIDPQSEEKHCNAPGEEHSQMMHSNDIDPPQSEEKHDQTSWLEHSELAEDACLFHVQTEPPLQLSGTATEKVIRNESSEMGTDLLQSISEELQESTSHEELQAILPTIVSTDYETGGALMDAIDELQSNVGDTEVLNTVMSASDVKLNLVQLATLATFIVASLFILGHHKQSKNVAKRNSPASSVQFLRKSEQPPKVLDDEMQQDRQPSANANQDKQQFTMIEELNDKFASMLQSPEPNRFHQRSPHTREDEDLMRSPIPASATSPYGSFTTYKLMPKKEGQGVETKLTPVRRSSRIRNNVSMSPNANPAKRIAISPP